MHSYMMHTLVDITKNGSLTKTFPFETNAGDLIDGKEALRTARRQNANFETMIQLLQIRGNITWEATPTRMEMPGLANHMFGSFYEGKNTMWNFQFFTEQSGVYGDVSDPV